MTNYLPNYSSAVLCQHLIQFIVNHSLTLIQITTLCPQTLLLDVLPYSFNLISLLSQFLIYSLSHLDENSDYHQPVMYIHTNIGGLSSAIPVEMTMEAKEEQLYRLVLLLWQALAPMQEMRRHR